MSDTTTIRVSHQTHCHLKALAKESGEPLATVLEKAVDAYRRQRMLEETNAFYAELRKDPQRWAEEMKERQLWETTLMDGLEEY
jgi:predicted DNA-binding protein